MRSSAILSWAIFLFAAGLFAMAVWTRLFPSGTGGAWQDQYIGNEIGVLPLEDAAGNAVSVSHPALLYFYGPDCRFCPPAQAEMNALAGRPGVAAPPIYAITKAPSLRPYLDAHPFHPGVRTARLKHPTRSLSFVRQVPTIVRTTPDGRVDRVYVGVPGKEVVEVLRVPRVAGPAARQ